MNDDFTKEELEELLFFTELHKNKYRLKYPEELINKIKSMIDSYCEHNKPYAKPGITVCLDCNNVIKNPDGIDLDDN